MKRVFDLVVVVIGGLLLAPFVALSALAIWLYDFASPIYIAKRVGLNGATFNMFKLRTMYVNAESSGVDSTSAADPRITPIGTWVRKFKLDELLQLLNVLQGDMSLVGPRPNVPREVAIYTKEEQNLLNVKPGITDISSIVFSDLADILKNESDPDIAYNQLVRPWKSRLSLFYIKRKTLFLDCLIIAITVIAIMNRPLALRCVACLLNSLNADSAMIKVALRNEPLTPTPPPGANNIVTSRKPVTVKQVKDESIRILQR